MGMPYIVADCLARSINRHAVQSDDAKMLITIDYLKGVALQAPSPEAIVWSGQPVAREISQ